MIPIISEDSASEERILKGESRYRDAGFLQSTLFGSVDFAKDLVTDEWVVIKKCSRKHVLSKISLRGNVVSEDIEKEIELHKRLCQDTNPCPFIIELREVYEDAEFINIVLEYADGGDLLDHVIANINRLLAVHKSRRSEEEKNRILKEWWNDVRKWIQQLLLALKYLHERNICHRDVSLENTMLKQGDVRLIDFGNAHEYTNANFKSERNRIGKLQYMRPECFADRHYDGRDNDMWCIGVMLWTSLIGAPPWTIANKADKRFALIMKGKMGIKGLLES